MAVFFEAFFWGLGTAIGELPPYLFARVASASEGTDKEFEEILNSEHPDKAEKVQNSYLWRI